MSGQEWTIYCGWSFHGDEFPASVDPEPVPNGEPFKVVSAEKFREAVDLLLEARAMMPHADESSNRRNDWCARADAILPPLKAA